MTNNKLLITHWFITTGNDGKCSMGQFSSGQPSTFPSPINQPSTSCFPINQASTSHISIEESSTFPSHIEESSRSQPLAHSSSKTDEAVISLVSSTIIHANIFQFLTKLSLATMYSYNINMVIISGWWKKKVWTQMSGMFYQ